MVNLSYAVRILKAQHKLRIQEEKLKRFISTNDILMNENSETGTPVYVVRLPRWS